MKRVIIVLLAIVAISYAQHAYAWGSWAHRFIAHTADRYLEPEAKQKVEKYLGSPIIDHCVWMDKIRRPIFGKTHPDHAKMQVYRPTIRWHNVTVDEKFHPSDKRSAKGSGALFPNLEQCVENLRNYRNLTDSAVAVNLKFAIHMLQDMHCPGHIFYTEFPDCFTGKTPGAKSRSFMPINYEGKKTSYHALWDGVALRSLYPEYDNDYEMLRKQMDKCTSRQRAKICRGSLEDWLVDAGKRCRPIYDNVAPNDTLNHDFFVKRRKITEGQAMRSAYRLAHLLNEIFK